MRQLYDSDFYLWTQSAAEQLRSGSLKPDDREHAAEELADMGKRDRRELQSRMIVLVKHLIKWAAQPELRNTSTWLATINEQRTQIVGILEQSPSLRALLDAELLSVYAKAVKQAAIETRSPGLELTGSPVFADRLLCEDFLPETINDMVR